MLPALRPHRRFPVACLRRLLCTPSSSGTGESGNLPVDAAAKARAEAEARARAEAYKKVQHFDWSSGADWKTAANILFTVPPKRKEFGIVMMLSLMELLPVPVYNLCLTGAWDLTHLEVIARLLGVERKKATDTMGVENTFNSPDPFNEKTFIQNLLFSIPKAKHLISPHAVYLVAQYARSEIKRMEGEAEEKRKKDEELEKQKQLEEESAKEVADSNLSKVLDRLDTLEVVVKEIVDDKRKLPSPDSRTKEEVGKKDKAPPGKGSDSKNVVRE